MIPGRPGDDAMLRFPASPEKPVMVSGPLVAPVSRLEIVIDPVSFANWLVAMFSPPSGSTRISGAVTMQPT